MDLPSATAAAAASSPATAAHFLPPPPPPPPPPPSSISTGSANPQNNSPPRAHPIGHLPLFFPPTQSAAGPSSSALGTPQSLATSFSGPGAGAVLGPIPPTGKCAHKDLTRCTLHQGNCCSCSDNRPHEQYYDRYVDGIEVRVDAPRWAHYCSSCKDHWDRLHSRVPPFRENQPRITAWDLFHLATPPNVPPSVPILPLSDPTRNSLPPSAQVAVLPPDDGFPPSYAVFRLMSPNFSSEYHPRVAEHIRSWGELENRIADEPRYSPGFHSLLAQYHNARFKAKRMTELDRQLRGGGLSVQASDEYLQLLSNPSPFDLPSSSSPGGLNAHGASQSGNPNLGNIGTSFSRAANLGSFMSSQSMVQQGNSQPPNPNSNQGTTANQPAGSVSSTTRRSPLRSHSRRGSTPFEGMGFWASTGPRSPPGARIMADGEQDHNRNRDTGSSSAGTSSIVAATTTTAAPSMSLPLSSLASHSIPPESPSELQTHHFFSSPSRPLFRPTPSTLLRQRSRTLASVATDVETDHAAENRRRQVRERVESEWENQRPISATSAATSGNRNSVDTPVIDAIMSDVPSSQGTEGAVSATNTSTEPARPLESEPHLSSHLRRTNFLFSPTSEPWSVQLLGESGRNQTNDPSALNPPRRDDQSSSSTGHLGPTPEAPPASNPSSTTGFIFTQLNRRPSLRNTSQETGPGILPQIPSESSSTMTGLTSPTNRLSAPANFLPSLPHLPAPRFSPTRNPARPRGASISNNTSGHSRQNSTGSDGFPSATASSRRRERTNTLAQALGTRADVEREDYESPLRTMFTQNYEEYQRAEERRRLGREMEAEQRDFLNGQAGSNPEANMRRLQEHRNRQYEFLHRVTLQRQIDHFHAQQNRLQTANNSVLNNLYAPQFPVPHHHHHNHNHNHNPRSPDEPNAMPFGMSSEDDPSSNSEGDYEDLILIDNPFVEADNLYGIVDGHFNRAANENTPPHRLPRQSRARRPSYMANSDEISIAGGNPAANSGTETERDRLRARIERSRRLRESELIRNRQTEALRDIVGFVDGVRNTAMHLSRWNRDREGGGGPGRNNNAQTRTLDHPERPDNLKEDDLKIMVDCKVCYGQIADIVLLPCAHLVLCQWCAETVAPTAPNRPEGTVLPRSNCPVCRSRVEKKIKVFRC